MNQSVHHVELFIGLSLIAVAVAMAVNNRWLKLPYSIALVIVGLVIGISQVMPPVELTPELILIVFLPPLLFEAAWNFDLPGLKQSWLPIAVMATFGVVVSLAVTALALHFLGSMEYANAFIVGAMLASTDPISVLAIFKQLGVNKRLSVLLEGESLFNDGTTVVLFQIILACVINGSTFSLPMATLNFLVIVFGGGLVGLALGYCASNINKYVEDHLLETMLTTIIAYGSYLLADQLHVSAVIAVVTSGIVYGNYGSRQYMSATTRLAINTFWEYAAFTVNSLLFLLIGLQVKLDLLIANWQLIFIGIIALLVSRAVAVYGLYPFLATKYLPVPTRWRHILFWGGLRGSLSMALALSLPLTFPYREQLVVLVFGVVLFTLLVQGLSMETVLKILRIRTPDPKLKEYQLLSGKLYAENAATKTLESLLNSHSISRKVYERLKAETSERQRVLKEKIEALHMADSSIEKLQIYQARKHMLVAKRDTLSTLSRRDGISSEITEELAVDIDQEIDGLTYTSPARSDDNNSLDKRV